MRIDTRHVRYFLAICDEKSFTRAAQKLGITQPTLTNVIQKFESKLGQPLFIRSTREPYAEPTTLGRKLLPIFVEIKKLIDRVHSLV